MTDGYMEPWIGMVHLKPVRQPNVLGKRRKGAYVNAVALAKNADHFKERVEEALKDDGLGIVEASDVDRVSSYRKDGRINEEIDELIDALSDNSPVQFDVFDTYVHDDS